MADYVVGWRNYSDSATSAASIGLALHRLAEGRRHHVDVRRVWYFAKRIEELSKGIVGYDERTSEEVFASPEGNCVIIKTILDKDKKVNVVEKLGEYSKQLYEVADNKPNAREKAGELERFFEKMQAVADELSVLGLQENPVGFLFAHINIKDFLVK